MLGRQAKIISPAMLQAMLDHVDGHQHAARDRVIILLSVKAGLRACEIAGLTWPMVLTPKGKVSLCVPISFSLLISYGPKVSGRWQPILTPVQPFSLWEAVTMAQARTSRSNCAK
jgi:hypothetical protein